MAIDKQLSTRSTLPDPGTFLQAQAVASKMRPVGSCPPKDFEADLGSSSLLAPAPVPVDHLRRHPLIRLKSPPLLPGPAPPAFAGFAAKVPTEQ